MLTNSVLLYLASSNTFLLWFFIHSQCRRHIWPCLMTWVMTLVCSAFRYPLSSPPPLWKSCNPIFRNSIVTQQNLYDETSYFIKKFQHPLARQDFPCWTARITYLQTHSCPGIPELRQALRISADDGEVLQDGDAPHHHLLAPTETLCGYSLFHLTWNQRN